MTAASCSNRRDLIEKRAILARMTTRANSVEEYLAQYSGERRAALEAVRQVIVDHLNPGFEEGIQYGMIGYYVPHSKFPSGYHCDTAQPLPFASLGAQKHHMALYLMFIYGDAEQERFRSEWAKTGKKLDMGKSCVRFKRLDDLALDVIGATVKSLTVEAFIEQYEQSRAASNASKTRKKIPSKTNAQARKPKSGK